MLGHEIVGMVVEVGPEVERIREGGRVGGPWLGWTCGCCLYCLSGRENLCVRARFTGYQFNGGYAEYTVANERFCFPIPPLSDVEAAPLLCAGLIGYRALRLAGDASRLGLYGFGAAAIRKVVGGGLFVSESVGELLARDTKGGADVPPHTLLSDREFQVFNMIVQGKTVTDIAAELTLSVKTVSTHKTHVLEKMNLSNQAELVRYAIAHQLLDDPATPAD